MCSMCVCVRVCVYVCVKSTLHTEHVHNGVHWMREWVMLLLGEGCKFESD